MRFKPPVRALAAAAAMLLSTAAGALGADGADGALLFVSNRSGNAQIHRMQADGSADRALTLTPQENTEPAWSPDGRQIAFTSYRDGNAEIYLMDADGSHQRRLTQHPMADNAPSWTPDGRIVFRSMRERWANLYVMNADGSGLRPLTATPTDKSGPVLAPDGRTIAFVTHGEKGGSDIFVVPVAGGEPVNLTGALPGKQKSQPAWSPDSRRLAYVEANGTVLNLRVVDADGRHPGKITDNEYMNASPAWSPDGRRIAFVSGRDGSRIERARGDIFVMNADGSGTVNLTHHPDEDNYPAWSADGGSIYFVSLRDGNGQIYAVPSEGGGATRLTHSQGFDLMIRPLDARAARSTLATLPSAAPSSQHLP